MEKGIDNHHSIHYPKTHCKPSITLNDTANPNPQGETAFPPDELAIYANSLNHVIRRALNHGVPFPKSFSRKKLYRNPPPDLSGERQVTANITHSARRYLELVYIFADPDPYLKHDLSIGQKAHRAVNDALKALISASLQKYPITWEIDRLAQAAAAADPDLRWEPRINPDCYNQYTPEQPYEPPPADRISDKPDFVQLITEDVTHILDRVKKLQPNMPQPFPHWQSNKSQSKGNHQ